MSFLNKKTFYLILLILICSSIFYIYSLTKSISFYGSGCFDPNNVDLKTEGYTSFGQYKYVGVGYTEGGGAGRETYSFRGGPQGEIIAVWRTFLENNENEVIKVSEKLYYAYTSKPNFGIPIMHLLKNEPRVYLSYGSLFLYEEYVPIKKRNNRNLYINKHGVKLYLFGRKDYFYYSVQDKEGRYYSIPFEKYEKIPAIRITKEQFDYYYKEYSDTRENFYLDEAPNVTKEQLEYMKKQGRKIE